MTIKGITFPITFTKNMRIHIELDDSTIDRINFLKDKLFRERARLREWIDEDPWGNQLFINQSIEKIEYLQQVLDHLLYN
nr:hypothetical protein [Cressdnaviricota sp.]